jgi:GntR family transcriptional regulator, transcriptional repressor for pyruvate dehydrogenase complex
MMDDNEPRYSVDQRRGAPRIRAARRRVKISQIIASEIVRDIVERDLHEGDRLPTEVEMLQEFEVGRASIREALRILEGFGLISIRQGQNGGPVVAALKPQDLGRTLSFYFHMTGATYAELIEARLVIEPVMARLAAERQDPDSIRQLRETTEREQRASLEDPDYLACAEDFHAVVSGISGNRVLDLLSRALRNLYQERTAFGALLPPEARPLNRAVHKRIADAILAGEGEEAATLMEEHLQDLAAALQERMPTLRGDRITWED